MQLAVDRPHRRGDTREDGILLFYHTNISARNLNEYLRNSNNHYELIKSRLLRKNQNEMNM